MECTTPAATVVRQWLQRKEYNLIPAHGWKVVLKSIIREEIEDRARSKNPEIPPGLETFVKVDALSTISSGMQGREDPGGQVHAQLWIQEYLPTRARYRFGQGLDLVAEEGLALLNKETTESLGQAVIAKVVRYEELYLCSLSAITAEKILRCKKVTPLWRGNLGEAMWNRPWGTALSEKSWQYLCEEVHECPDLVPAVMMWLAMGGVTKYPDRLEKALKLVYQTPVTNGSDGHSLQSRISFSLERILASTVCNLQDFKEIFGRYPDWAKTVVETEMSLKMSADSYT